MRLRCIGVVESIHATRDEDAALPQKAFVGLRLVMVVNRASEHLEIAGDGTVRDNGNVKTIGLRVPYADAQGLAVGDEVTILAYQRPSAVGPGQCGECGNYVMG